MKLRSTPSTTHSETKVATEKAAKEIASIAAKAGTLPRLYKHEDSLPPPHQRLVSCTEDTEKRLTQMVVEDPRLSRRPPQMLSHWREWRRELLAGTGNGTIGLMMQ